MDEMVLKAMIKWPNVPACRGWLGLDARGDWYMRDDHVQSLGPFAGVEDVKSVNSRACKGSRLLHDKLIAFITRNYASDDQGQWFFQNGPQRVFVELELAPWIWRISPDIPHAVTSHTGLNAQVRQAITDEYGYLYLYTDIGLGTVHTQDMDLAADWLLGDVWPLSTMQREALPDCFGFVLSPEQKFRASLPSSTSSG